MANEEEFTIIDDQLELIKLESEIVSLKELVAKQKEEIFYYKYKSTKIVSNLLSIVIFINISVVLWIL